jgi:hypothetical protein
VGLKQDKKGVKNGKKEKGTGTHREKEKRKWEKGVKKSLFFLGRLFPLLRPLIKRC